MLYVLNAQEDSSSPEEAESRVVGVLTIEDIIEELLQTEVSLLWTNHDCDNSSRCPSSRVVSLTVLQIIDETDRFVVGYPRPMSCSVRLACIISHHDCHIKV